MSLLQIVLLFLIGFTFTRAFLRMREGVLEVGAFVFWALVWMMGILVVLFPNIVTRIAGWIGVGRGADVVVYISLVILFYLVFRTNVALENLHHELTELVREISLKEFKNSSNKRKSSRRKQKV